MVYMGHDAETDKGTKPSFEEEMKRFAERTGMVPIPDSRLEGRYGFAQGKHAHVLITGRPIEELIAGSHDPDIPNTFGIYVDKDLFGTAETLDSIFKVDQQKLYPETFAYAEHVYMRNLASVICEKLNEAIENGTVFEDPAQVNESHKWVLGYFPIFPMVVLNMMPPIPSSEESAS